MRKLDGGMDNNCNLPAQSASTLGFTSQEADHVPHQLQRPHLRFLGVSAYDQESWVIWERSH